MNNDLKAVQQRKYQSHLMSGGMGVIAFGLWDVLKGLVTAITTPVLQDVGDADASVIAVAYIMYFLVFTIFFGLSVATRLYVGISARQEAQGKKKGSFYLIIAGLMAVLSVAGAILYLVFPDQFLEQKDTAFTTFAIDITSMVIISQMIYSAIQLRKARRKEA